MRKIVLLERLGLPSADKRYRVAFRLAVPDARQIFHANPNATSADRFAPQDELNALRAGEWVEQVADLTAPAGTPDEQAFAMLQGSWDRRQQEVNDRNEWCDYGTSWDGVSWSRVTVA